MKSKYLEVDLSENQISIKQILTHFCMFDYNLIDLQYSKAEICVIVLLHEQIQYTYYMTYKCYIVLLRIPIFQISIKINKSLDFATDD